MIQLSEEQLNNLGKDALVIIVSSLQDQLLSLQQQLQDANSRFSDNNRQIELLTEQIRLMNQRQFGRKTEAALSDMDGQLTLFDSFNEAEFLKKEDAPEPAVEKVIISSYRRSRSKGKRDADLDGLPARIFEHRLSQEELDTYFPNGYKELPVETYIRLHIIPETFIVDEHHVHVYASKNNDGSIIKAQRPTDLFRNRAMRSTYPIVLFDWQCSRHANHPRTFLKNFSGAVITDGYQVYHKLADERRDLKIGGCVGSTHADPSQNSSNRLGSQLPKAQLHRRHMT